MSQADTTIGLEVLSREGVARRLDVPESEVAPGDWIALRHETPPFLFLCCIDIEGGADEESSASSVGRRAIEIARAVAVGSEKEGS